MDIFPIWDKLQHGDSISVVLQTLVHGPASMVMSTIESKVRRVIVKGNLPTPNSDRWVFLNAKVIEVLPTCVIELGEQSFAHRILPCLADTILRVTELCCGMGGFSRTAPQLGVPVVLGVDQNPKWETLFRNLHGADAHFLVGDCGDNAVIHEALSKGASQSVTLAGINCQPFSVAGDRRGLMDPRSQSLFHALRASWLFQSPITVLECTPAIANDPQVQQILKEFCGITGCTMTQQLLSLQDVWCAKRERWYVILAAGVLGPVHIPPLPKTDEYGTVAKIIQSLKQWPQGEHDQLELSLYELNLFHQYAVGGIDAAWLSFDFKLPTCLHSAGNQLYPCKCGCRQALSLSRIQEKGLFGTLVPLRRIVRHCNANLMTARYLHPTEMFALNGGHPSANFGDDMRLALAAIGQSVSCIHGLWIISHVIARLQSFAQVPVCDPKHALALHLEEVSRACHELWPSPVVMPPGGNSDILDHQPSDSVMCDFWDRDAGAPITFRATHPVCKQFCEAENKLRNHMGEINQCADVIFTVSDMHGVPVAGNDALPVSGSVGCGLPLAEQQEVSLPCPCHEWCNEQTNAQGSDVSPTQPFTVQSQPQNVPSNEMSALLQLDFGGLVDLVCPKLTSLDGFNHLQASTLPCQTRQAILDNQFGSWANDEMLHFLQEVGMNVPSDQHVTVWDPFLITSIVKFANSALLSKLVDTLMAPTTIITAAVVDGHWYPLVWQFTGQEVWGFTCGHVFGLSIALQRVHREFCRLTKCAQTALKFQMLAFSVRQCCGALAISYVRHVLFGDPLPSSADEVQSLHSSLRQQFQSQLAAQTQRPWIWGLGESADWQVRFGVLLQEHGVQADDVQARMKTIIDKLGEANVIKAMNAGSPWKELKWLGNNSSPILQLIKPAELQAAIAKKSGKGATVGTKAQKKAAGKGKGKGKSQCLDPNGLRIDVGLFVCGEGHQLPQIDIATIGPQVSGIVLASLATAQPYLRSGKQMSLGGIGLIIVDAKAEDIQTNLIAEPVRFPAVCLANEEPLLVDGVLFQLGAQPVSKFVASEQCALVTLRTCVIKVMLYRDQVDCSWETIQAHPLKYLFAKVPPLQPCNDEQCGGQCESWHVSASCQLADPLMEVWGRQWLTQSYMTVIPSEAEIYGAHIRVPECLQIQLQHYSGQSGVYLEPKHIDGRSPSTAFQAIWLPKHSYADIVVLKQQTSAVLGVARSGTKYGVRCLAEKAQELHRLIKPGGMFLPPGRKLDFLVGPVAFGTLKTSIASMLASIDWLARPVQPVSAASHINGVMWRVQSVSPPPRNVVATDQGDIVITSLTESVTAPRQGPTVVAAPKTLELCTETSAAKKIDPLQVYDPWEINSCSKFGKGGGTNCPADFLEQKVVDAVLARLPKQQMDVDSTHESQAMADKVQTLEMQVRELHDGQSHLHQMVVEQGRSNAQQFNQLEAAVTDNATRLGNFQHQFKAQLEQQQSQLDSLFQQQMHRIEDLLSKKQRTE